VLQIWNATVAVGLVDADFAPWTWMNLLNALIDTNTLGLGIECFASSARCTLMGFTWVGWTSWAITCLTGKATSKIDASLVIGTCMSTVSTLVRIDTLVSLTIGVRNTPETGAAINGGTCFERIFITKTLEVTELIPADLEWQTVVCFFFAFVDILTFAIFAVETSLALASVSVFVVFI
jgi:hypothetical protein